MINIKTELLEALATREGMQTALQIAIELEHATIPTYLYTYYSLAQGIDPVADEVASFILSVAMDEMAHFATACNLLNAIGGNPRIYFRDFVPAFPQPLPGSVNAGLQIHLDRFSPGHVRDVFMEIEEPEVPLEFRTSMLTEEIAPATIGTFYRTVRQQLAAAGESAVIGDPAKQVVVARLKVAPIRSAQDAIAAIDRIVEEGEGTEDNPITTPGSRELAHYYRFAQLAKEGRLMPNPDATPASAPIDRFLYDTASLVVPAACIYPLRRNPTIAQLPAGSLAVLKTREWNTGYTEMLRLLHDGFNGQPGSVNGAVDLMMQLGYAATDLVTMELGDGTNAAPTFEFVGTTE